ncbi:hypothetical protein RA307_27220, partial [Xanthobacteraceae bacterium Astr-EGSB]|uniref:hypothetical protein n=1 Tax=Astrobacterium formosum TaxID=3069710 RepID=UPI0027B01BBE|nr:hypothetical protein [Xanthobacteraceae bacterium Astr-EGSB]
MSVLRLLSALSVRMRIVLLAVIPLVGFLAVGVAFTNGGRTIDTAMGASRVSAQVADASRELKVALGQVMLSATNYSVRPNQKGVESFTAARESAASLAAAIANSGKAGANADKLPQALDQIGTTFAELKKVTEKLGYTDTSGLHGRMRAAIAQAQGAIQMLAFGPDGQTLQAALQKLENHVKDFRLDHKTMHFDRFSIGYDMFDRQLENVEANETSKTAVVTFLKELHTTFAEYVKLVGEVDKWLAEIGAQTQSAATTADAIAVEAAATATSAADELTSSRTVTENLTLVTGLVAVFLSIVASWL